MGCPFGFHNERGGEMGMKREGEIVAETKRAKEEKRKKRKRRGRNCEKESVKTERKGKRYRAKE